MKINYGCGKSKMKGFVNIDIEPSCTPDVVCDVRNEDLPYKKVDLIVAFHVIEHIEHLKQGPVLQRFLKALKPGGRLILSFPEFERCAKNFIENHRGMKDFWRMTLYGRQLYPGDYHVTPMVTADLVSILRTLGFENFNCRPEPLEPHNTIVECTKAVSPLNTTAALKQVIFTGHTPKDGRFKGVSVDKSATKNSSNLKSRRSK